MEGKEKKREDRTEGKEKKRRWEKSRIKTHTWRFGVLTQSWCILRRQWKQEKKKAIARWISGSCSFPCYVQTSILMSVLTSVPRSFLCFLRAKKLLQQSEVCVCSWRRLKTILTLRLIPVCNIDLTKLMSNTLNLFANKFLDVSVWFDVVLFIVT